MQFEFQLLQWSTRIPTDGLTQPTDWWQWALATPQLPGPSVAVVPALPQMPAMMRRRLDRLGRLACHVAYACHPSEPAIPMVFASRYGDSAGSLALLDDLIHEQPVSPMGFGLSVHNAVSALYSIAQGHTDNTVVVAAGPATVTAALTEAAALLADCAREVLVVYYEAPLPQEYTQFQDEMACEYAWAWRVARPNVGHLDYPSGATIAIKLAALTTQAESAAPAWPTGLTVLRQVLRQLSQTHVDQAVLVPHVAQIDVPHSGGGRA